MAKPDVFALCTNVAFVVSRRSFLLPLVAIGATSVAARRPKCDIWPPGAAKSAKRGRKANEKKEKAPGKGVPTKPGLP